MQEASDHVRGGSTEFLCTRPEFFRTFEIKSRIEAMFADWEELENQQNRSRQSRSVRVSCRCAIVFIHQPHQGP
ncbi:hypothetical protein [Rhodococcus opacus]|uniref:hypothetical protein n=1 Tax=Rhodococcus opacus TaxID=37919 RepID=UPI0024BA03E1|nr:hypothetical protein [Rhodococcus opacus]MDJ0417990.1 hypothetical protein [Rhodococcus opacus]